MRRSRDALDETLHLMDEFDEEADGRDQVTVRKLAGASLLLQFGFALVYIRQYIPSGRFILLPDNRD